MLLWITLARDSLNTISNMKTVLSIVALALIIAFKAMAYEEANYQVVKTNELYEIRKYSDRLAVEHQPPIKIAVLENYLIIFLVTIKPMKKLK